MSKKILSVVLLALAGTAHAQAPACSCDPTATRTTSNDNLVMLLTRRMVCGQVGSEKWQEWHNGTSSGPIVDYKLGPGVAPDPSAEVGSYSISDNLVSYTYGSGPTYKYEVCLVVGGASFTFCGAPYGGRNITGVRIAGSGGLQSCGPILDPRGQRPTGSRTSPPPPPAAQTQTAPAAQAAPAPAAPAPSTSRVPVLKP